MDQAVEMLWSRDLESIGRSRSCTVWSAPGPDTGVVSRELLPLCIKAKDKGQLQLLTNERVWLKVINEKIHRFSESSFLVPILFGNILKTDTPKWEKLLGRLPPESEACNALVMETIQPMKLSARREMIERYCHPEARSRAMENLNGTNRHCLLRVYLGSYRSPDQLRLAATPSQWFEGFSVRNLPFYLDQLRELQLPVQEYARTTARGLAFLNWIIGTDGYRVEFVLAPPRTEPILKSMKQKTWDSPLLGAHALWLLDFDCCHGLNWVDAVELIARSFWSNGPYFPRPGRESAEDQGLWRIWCEEYEKASLEMMPMGVFALTCKARRVDERKVVEQVIAKIEAMSITKTKAMGIAKNEALSIAKEVEGAEKNEAMDSS